MSRANADCYLWRMRTTLATAGFLVALAAGCLAVLYLVFEFLLELSLYRGLAADFWQA